MRCHSPRQGFTITELLVVTSIIAVLISLALVGVGIVREAARATQCGSNLHVIGIFMETYASEQRGCYPPAQHRWWLSWNGYTDYADGTSRHEDVWGNPWNFWAYYLMKIDCPSQSEWNGAWSDTGESCRWGFAKRWPRNLPCPSALVQFAGNMFPDPAVQKPARELGSSSYGMNSAYLDFYGSEACAAWPWLAMHSTQGSSGWPGYGIGLTGMRDTARYRRAIPNPANTISVAEHSGDPLFGFTLITDPPFVQDPVDANDQVIPGPAGSRVAPFTTDWTDKALAFRASHRHRGNGLFNRRSDSEAHPVGDQHQGLERAEYVDTTLNISAADPFST